MTMDNQQEQHIQRPLQIVNFGMLITLKTRVRLECAIRSSD